MSPAVSFIDTNVPVYAGGRDHPYKAPCARILSMVLEYPYCFVTGVEVLQELIHRSLAIRQWDHGRTVLRDFAHLMHGRIEPFYVGDIEVAATLADRHQGISARDLLHVAVMRRLGVDRIISADKGFDRLPGIVRLDPADVDEWEGSILGVNGGLSAG